jgi:nickel transport protein
LNRSGLARIAAVAVLLATQPAGPALAHGAVVDAVPTGAVAVQARYDTGEPMAGAQITIYAPDDPVRPWAVAVADADGQFLFQPDADRTGRWAIQARQAGHGAMGYVEVTAGNDAVVVAAPEVGLTLAQRLLMLASVGWGCVGTAAYFVRSRGGPGGDAGRDAGAA